MAGAAYPSRPLSRPSRASASGGAASRWGTCRRGSPRKVPLLTVHRDRWPLSFPDGSREAHITGTINTNSATRATTGMTMAAVTEPDIAHHLLSPVDCPPSRELFLAGPGGAGAA